MPRKKKDVPVTNGDPQAKPLNPETALVKIRNYLESLEGTQILGKDGHPIHWMVKDENYGLLLLDSAFMMTNFGFSGIQMHLGSTQKTAWLPEEIAPHFQRFLDWLALNVPPSKGWAVEYKMGCPIIPCDREIIEG